ncbi:MAG: hypothetical protein EOO51_09015 [Flavobacterium sp.]|nr:MAG: hypothetical protein EOO51_09015 [Flavobacterium sp.]
MSALLIFITALLLTSLIIRWHFLVLKNENAFRKKSNLILAAAPIPNRFYCQAQIESLPYPVRKYFSTVLTEGQPYVKNTELEHDGYIRLNKGTKWTGITGHELFSTYHPEFIWMGKTTWFTAVDSYAEGKGSLTVRLLSAVKIADLRGPKIDQSELLRWLAEGVWFPTALLPAENISWQPVNENTAILNLNWKRQFVSVTVRFSADYTIHTLEAERFDEKGHQQKWLCELSNYKKHDGMLIPETVEVKWASEREPYAKFKLRRIIYNQKPN